MSAENNIIDEFENAFDEISDRGLERLIEAFQSGTINYPSLLIREIHKVLIDQKRYRKQGIEL